MKDQEPKISQLQKIADAWFDPFEFEKKPGFYEKKGIRFIKRYTPTSGDIVANLILKKTLLNEDFVKPNLESLRAMESTTRKLEAFHLASFLVFSSLFYYELRKGIYNQAALVLSVNALINVPPVMLQRYNRIRLYRAIKTMERLENLSN